MIICNFSFSSLLWLFEISFYVTYPKNVKPWPWECFLRRQKHRKMIIRLRLDFLYVSNPFFISLLGKPPNLFCILQYGKMCFWFSLCGKISVQNIIKRSPAKVIYLSSNFGQLAVGLRGWELSIIELEYQRPNSWCLWIL